MYKTWNFQDGLGEISSSSAGGGKSQGKYQHCYKRFKGTQSIYHSSIPATSVLIVVCVL